MQSDSMKDISINHSDYSVQARHIDGGADLIDVEKLEKMQLVMLYGGVTDHKQACDLLFRMAQRRIM